MPVPKIIHQLWKTESLPARWRGCAESVRKYHKGWQYRVWTDAMMASHVRVRHPELYPVFVGMERQIMRVDVFRYVLMHDIGGLYCDLDYEFLRPFDYGDADVVLSLEYDESYGDDENQIANYLFASAPGHALWADIIGEVRERPPSAPSAAEVCAATGPQLISRVFFRNRQRYDNVRVTEKPVFSPRRVHGRYERKFYLNTGMTWGFHHGWGSWRERLSMSYVQKKAGKLVARLNVREHLGHARN